MILCCAPIKAQEKTNEPPSMAFLEYLADMEEVDGKFYGPQDMNFELCQSKKEEQKEKHIEIRTDINGIQNDKPPKNEDQATEQECKSHG